MDTENFQTDELCQIVVLVNKRGLHARAAAKLVQAAAQFKAEVFVACGDMRVSGQSIMGLMMLAAPCGTRIRLCASGSEAAQTLDFLADLVRRGFDEE
ncbi:MAG TPA: HPr family phosphocarrier protein [Rhodospirillaceae bacterium]|nr:HPr family phosphocarrier protein [Rhodospirillaceae bacterium]